MIQQYNRLDKIPPTVLVDENDITHSRLKMIASVLL